MSQDLDRDEPSKTSESLDPIFLLFPHAPTLLPTIQKQVKESTDKGKNFEKFFLRVEGNEKRLPKLPKCILALDPGETTGVSVFYGPSLILCDQINTSNIRQGTIALERIIGTLNKWFPEFGSLLVVMEDYRVYAWRIKQHAWSSLHTPRLIGSIECLCIINDIAYLKQSASTGKNFCEDERLREWGYYVEGQKHARDAIRHGCQWLLFGSEDDIRRNKLS